MRTKLIPGVIILAGLALWVSAAGGQDTEDAETAGPELTVHEHVLDNGLRVLIAPRRGVPLVSTYVWYEVGSMDEEPGRTGMAHFLEHMMFKGSRNYEVGQVDEVTVRNGGSNNAFTSNDFTAYYINLPRSRYHEALKIEADRMRHLTLDLEEFNAEKKVVQSETDVSADNPARRLWQRLDTELYGPGHPYAHPILGWPQDVEDTSRRDMREFYDRHYHPNRATIVLVGDITEQEGLGAVTRHFADIPRGPDASRPEVSEVELRGPVEFEVQSDSKVVEFGRQYPTRPAGHRDIAALDMAAMILGSGVTSRLYRTVVEERGIATAISSGHYEQRLGGVLWVWAQVAPGHTRDELKQAVRDVIAGLVDEGPTDEELQRTRNRFLSDRVFAQESASDLASALGRSQSVHGDWRYALEYPDRIREVTARDVRRVAATYLYEENTVTGWLVPELTPGDGGAAAPDALPEPLDVKRHVFPNGLTVLMLERPGLPVVSVNAAVRAGRSGEREGEAGLSRFTGSLLDAGTRDFTKQQIAETIQNIGAELSLGGQGGTVKALSEHADTALHLLAQCLQHPTFPESEVELHRAWSLASLEASRNETSWFARTAALATLYGPDNPIGQPLEGTPETVNAITPDKLHDWHRRWFRPDNCIVSVVGDFKSGEMLKRIEQEFGDWAKPSAPLKFPEFDLESPAALTGTQLFDFTDFDHAKIDPTKKRILVDHPEKDQVVVRLQTLGITRDNPDYYALLVMDNILGTSPGFTDRFSRKLRDEMGLAYTTYANITGGSGKYKGSFLGYIGTRPENVALALETMYALIEEIREHPVSADELRGAKDYLKGSFVFDVETTGQLAELLVDIERYGLGFDYLVTYADAVEAVTADEILRVARKYLVPGKMVEIMAGPVGALSETEDD